MNRYSLYTLPAIALALLLQPAGADVVSTFETGSDGWLVAGDATSAEPFYSETGGNPGGYIFADDRVSGGVWRWLAPDAYLGDQSGAFGQTLSFDLIQTGSGSQFSSFDVQLVDSASNEIRLEFDSNPLPEGEWVSYTIALDSSADWTTTNGDSADDATILSILSSLDVLTIRGEYISGPDTGGLDNVVLSTIPLPPALLMFASALAGVCLRARPRG